MLAFSLPAPIVLTISPSGDGMQIITSVPPLPANVSFVLQSTTNFSDWIPVATNTSGGGKFTNIVQVANQMTFYRVATKYHVVN